MRLRSIALNASDLHPRIQLTRRALRPHLMSSDHQTYGLTPQTNKTAFHDKQSEAGAHEYNLELRHMPEEEADDAHEPLIRPISPEPQDDGDAERDRQEEERSFEVPGLFIWVLTFCAGVSGLLFGYE